MYVPSRLSITRNVKKGTLHTATFYDIISAMKRTIWFWLYFIIAMIFSIYFCTRIVMTIKGHGPLSMVRNISISADKKDSNLSSLSSALALPPGTRSYSVDLDATNEIINGVPIVKESAIRRLPNGNLRIKVSLHHAVALWTDGENYYPLSADGTIVNTPTTDRNISNIVFRGPVPTDISQITKAAHNLVGELNFIEWIENRRWDMHTNSGIRIMLPETNPISALGTLISLNKKHNLLHKDIQIIDMRDSARILVK